jgi:hypothetical protein
MDPDSGLDADQDPDPAIFVIDLQDLKKKSFFAYYFLKVHLHHFQKKSQIEVTTQEESRFFLLFLLGERGIRIRIHTSD